MHDARSNAWLHPCKHLRSRTLIGFLGAVIQLKASTGTCRQLNVSPFAWQAAERAVAESNREIGGYPVAAINIPTDRLTHYGLRQVNASRSRHCTMPVGSQILLFLLQGVITSGQPAAFGSFILSCCVGNDVFLSSILTL
jgi:hypothetical protein